MSFDLFLFHFDGGEEPVSVPAADRYAAKTVLAKYRKFGDGNESVVILDEQGTEIDFDLRCLEDIDLNQCAFSLHSLSQSVSRFIFEFAQTTRMIIFDAQAKDDTGTYLVPGVDPRQLPPHCDTYRTVHTSEELHEILTGGVRRWARFRDRVLGKRQEQS